MKAFVVLASCALLASPAFAQSMNGEPAGANAAADNQQASEDSAGSGERASEERRICRRIETHTGSRMNSRRVCRTAAEWRDVQRDS